MCVYCMIGDHVWKHDPPWEINPLAYPTIPLPANPLKPIDPWGIDRLKEFRDLLKEVIELEKKAGLCPCEPNKADYPKLIADKIAELEQRGRTTNVKAS